MLNAVIIAISCVGSTGAQVPDWSVKVAVTALNADAWLASALPGFCGLTEEGSEGTCNLGERGSFGGTRLNLLLGSSNRTQAALACL